MLTLDRWRHEVNMKLGASTSAKSTGVKERGNAYHRKVYKLLEVHARVSMPRWQLLVEPWFRNMRFYPDKHVFRSPDTVLLHPETGTALVVEVKLNWKDGRDEKLITEYLPIVKSAFGLDCVWPLLVTQNIRGYNHPPLIGLKAIERAMRWHPGDPTPLMLLLK